MQIFLMDKLKEKGLKDKPFRKFEYLCNMLNNLKHKTFHKRSAWGALKFVMAEIQHKTPCSSDFSRFYGVRHDQNLYYNFTYLECPQRVPAEGVVLKPIIASKTYVIKKRRSICFAFFLNQEVLETRFTRNQRLSFLQAKNNQ